MIKGRLNGSYAFPLRFRADSSHSAGVAAMSANGAML